MASDSVVRPASAGWKVFLSTDRGQQTSNGSSFGRIVVRVPMMMGICSKETIKSTSGETDCLVSDALEGCKSMIEGYRLLYHVRQIVTT